jgi:hypothetical protein
MNSILRGLGALTLAVLAACGGGGGGDDAPAGVQVPQGTRGGAASASSNITESNFRTFAGPLARAVISASDAKKVPGVSNGRDAPQSRSERMAVQGQRWTRLALGVAAANISSREQPLATTTTPARCPLGGVLTLRLDDNDNNGKLSAGDRVSVVTLACVSEVGQPASTGSLALTINAIELNGNGDPTALDVTITFSGFAEDGFGSLTGSVRLWFKDDGSGNEQLRLSYSAAAVTAQGDSVSYDFDITGASGANGGSNVDLNGTFVIGGQGYAMTSTTFAFSAGKTNPGSGSVTLTDFLGNTVTLRARSDDTFELEFKPRGLPPLIIPGFLWNDQLLP